jgi:hypothetical protein
MMVHTAHIGWQLNYKPAVTQQNTTYVMVMIRLMMVVLHVYICISIFNRFVHSLTIVHVETIRVVVVVGID